MIGGDAQNKSLYESIRIGVGLQNLLAHPGATGMVAHVPGNADDRNVVTRENSRGLESLHSVDTDYDRICLLLFWQ